MAKTLLATIPVPFKYYREANEFSCRLKEAQILKDTRGDWSQMVEASPEDLEPNSWYVVIHTGNLRGMINDLKQVEINL